MSDLNSKKIWIDLENSPHVLFFNPIIKELKRRGYRVVVTARDYAQTCALADLFNLEYKRIGRHFGKNKFLKVFGMLFRAFQMIPILINEKPDLAFSHGSRAQNILATIAQIPVVEAGDYEHTSPTPFIRRNIILIPAAIPLKDIKKKYIKIFKYPGIKEDVYVPEFIPDPATIEKLYLNNEKVIITMRPPANLAHYHRKKSDNLFNTVINYLGEKPNTQIIIVPRTNDQALTIRKSWPHYFSNEKIFIPDQVVNGLDLIWHSDLVISAGGTMIREAAALNVPAYSIFGGKIGAVDRYLSETGRLTLVEKQEDVRNKIIIRKRNRPEKPVIRDKIVLNTIIEKIEKNHLKKQ